MTPAVFCTLPTSKNHCERQFEIVAAHRVGVAKSYQGNLAGGRGGATAP
jgi:hypothetical protein